MKHPDAALLHTYVEEGIPAHTKPPWSPEVLDIAISKVPYASACNPEMTSFIRGELRQRIKYGFSILLPVADSIQLFGERLKPSHIAVVPQAHRCPRLILDLLEQLDSDTLSVNETTDREAAPDSLHFSRALPRKLKTVWEAYPVQGPVRVSKLDVTDAYHRGTVKPAQVGAFAYVIPLAPGRCI